MFAGSYFGARYFGPRYFGKYGAASLGPGDYCSLLINGNGEFLAIDSGGQTLGISTEICADVDTPNTGGWGDAWSQERDDEAIRRQRVAMGIIPDEDAALEAVQAESRSKARQLAKQKESEARSQALTDQIIELERAIEAQEGINKAVALEAEKALANLSIIQRNQNAQAVLVMLSLI